MPDQTGGGSAAGSKASAAGAAAQRPSICRMVVYNDHGHPTPEQWPAVVVRVNANGSLCLYVMRSKNSGPIDNVTEGTAVGSWQWPSRETQPAA
jgi:hypothetical protein